MRTEKIKTRVGNLKYHHAPAYVEIGGVEWRIVRMSDDEDPYTDAVIGVRAYHDRINSDGCELFLPEDTTIVVEVFRD